MPTPQQRRGPTAAAQASVSPPSFRLQDDELLEEHEQIELIEQLERAAARQRHYSKALLAFLGLMLAALYCFFAVRQLAQPFSTPHQSKFRGHLRPHAVVAADLGGAAVALLAVCAAVTFPGRRARASWRSLLALSALVASLEAVFWAVAVFRVAEDTSARDGLWRLLWLPIVPPTFVLLIALALSVLGGTEPGIEALRRARYDYKRA